MMLTYLHSNEPTWERNLKVVEGLFIMWLRMFLRSTLVHAGSVN